MMIQKLRSLPEKARWVKYLTALAIRDIRNDFLGQLLPSKPETLNLLANDVCNSRCQMCLIWENKKDKELTPDELSKILEDDLFSKLKYVGVSGGEPTLRKDLPELFEAICSKKPRILGTGIITNGIIRNVVKQRILESAEICKSHDIPFNVMFSLDGVGNVHDTVRGRKDNFQSVISLLNYFHHETDIPTSFGCTITTSNALYVDELLDYAKEEGLYGRFRVAEFIERLYNSGQSEFIRAFDEETLYHLGLFFFRAEHDFERNPTFRKTYRNIRAMLTEGKSRQIGCPYQTKAAVLTSRGDLLYCAPKSPILGNVLDISASKIYFSNLSKRKKILQEDCDNCIHDYHVPITFQEELQISLKARKKRRRYDLHKLLELSARCKTVNADSTRDLLHLGSKTALIVGWYGTETVGDKAILWAVIDRLRSRPNPPEKIYLSSLYPFISHRTLKEIGLDGVSVVETYSEEFEKTCRVVDEIVVGGGPLMKLQELDHILYAFVQANRSGAFTRVEGCGIGPLSSSVHTEIVSEILRLAQNITLRDSASKRWCSEGFGIHHARVVFDPAVSYVQHIKCKTSLLQDGLPPLGTGRSVACFLREWGGEYAGDRDSAQYMSTKQRFETQLVQMLLSIAKFKEFDVHLLPMHSFHVGGDDRVFNRRIAKSFETASNTDGLNCAIRFTRKPISPIEILQTMYHAELNICMRFHSVLFAETLGVPYLAIDYTGGGKIRAFLQDKDKTDRLISLQDIADGKWQDCLARIHWI